MKTSSHNTFFLIALVFLSGTLLAQSTVTASLNSTASHSTDNGLTPAMNLPATKQKIVIVTGTRFAYPLVQKWIDDYNTVNQNVQIIIESRGSNDPTQYDILIEASEPDDALKSNREFLYIARYAILPVANSKSAFAGTYGDKGINHNLFHQLFFHDIYADKENEQVIKEPYTVYTRLQKAGAPIVFTQYFVTHKRILRVRQLPVLTNTF